MFGRLITAVLLLADSVNVRTIKFIDDYRVGEKIGATLFTACNFGNIDHQI